MLSAVNVDWDRRGSLLSRNFGNILGIVLGRHFLKIYEKVRGFGRAEWGKNKKEAECSGDRI